MFAFKHDPNNLKVSSIVLGFLNPTNGPAKMHRRQRLLHAVRKLTRVVASVVATLV